MKIWRPLSLIFSKGRSRSKEEETLVGRIAQSVSGRDKGTVYVISGQADGIFAFVCDGKKRTVSQPKRKNIRHLLISDDKIPDDLIVNGRLTADDSRIAAFIEQKTDI